MQSLTFVLEASLLAPLVEFATSSSGHVEPRQGLALGWLGSVVAGLAMVFGTADRAQAMPCDGIPEGGYRWEADCNRGCAYDGHGQARKWYMVKTSHTNFGCYETAWVCETSC